MTIDKGTPHGEKQVLHGEADDLPDMEPGDIVILVMQKPHKLFERKGADLVYEKKITLLEALTGTQFTIKHLSGKNIRIQSEPGQVIKPDSQMTCIGLGMPFYKKIYESGNLFIKFTVEFPDTIKQTEKLNQIHSALSKSQGQAVKKESGDEVDEVCMMQKLEDRHKNTHAEGGKTHDHEEEDEDDEEGGHGPQVGCQQQ